MSPELDLERLLAPLDPSAPCGSNLEYDGDFIALEEAARSRQEQEFGATLIEGQGPDWSAVWSHAQSLWLRTRDLRVAVWMARCAAHRTGLEGAVAGLELVHGLLVRFWDHLHPQLDAEDGNDPTQRLNALAPLVHYAEFMGDLRAAAVSSAQRGAPLRVRDIELALGRAAASEHESLPSESAVREALRQCVSATPQLVVTLQRGWEVARAIVQQIDAHCQAGQGPDFAPLVQLLRLLAQALPADNAGTQTPSPAGAADQEAGGGNPQAALTSALAPPGTINSRQDAVEALERACAWIEAHEPSHPAPLLIRRAQRLMNKSFIEIIRDLTPDAEDQVRRLAGTPAD